MYKISGRSKEAIGVIAVMLGVVILQWDLWVAGKRMLSHDSIIWFGAFSYFSDCLQHGILPLWNPYMNCGEIFFLNIHALHFWDPSTLFLVFAGKFLRIDTLTGYNYDLLLRYLVFISGSYLFFRHIAKHRFSAFVALIALAFSALCGSHLMQHGFIVSFYLLPWILFFTFKFLEEKNSVSLLWLAFLWGIASYSYHVMYLVSSVAILLLSLFVTKGVTFPKRGGFLKDRRFVLAAFFVFLLLSINLLPVFLAYTRDTVPTARIFEAPAAALSFPADFFNLFAPYSFVLHFELLLFNTVFMSESFLYIGLIPLFFAITGLFYSRHKYKRGLVLTLIITALLMLGPKFFVSKIFSAFLPFFSIIRNTHTFGTFFIFCLTCFTCLGTDVILELTGKAALSRYKKQLISIAIFISAAAFLITRYVLNIYWLPLKEPSAAFKMLHSLGEQDLIEGFREILSRSYYNVFLFIVSIMIIFYIIGKPRITSKFKYFTVISFVLIDLIVFNVSLFDFAAIEKVDVSLWPKEAPAYSNYRVPLVWPKYPFFGFAPAMQRKFAATSSKIPWITTHFYEMKDFFYFINDNRIPSDVKNVFMGITAPKLKFVRRAVVLPPDRQAEEYRKLNGKTANKLVFIEEDPPPEFGNLKTLLKDINNAKPAGGEIRVIDFGPNSIILETDSAQDGFLYYSDGFDKSWRAFIDGRETKVYRANMAFKSVIVGRGVHIVRFVYDPKLYKGAIFCYFAGILAAAAILVYAVLRREDRYA